MPNLSYTVSDFLPFTKIVSADVNSRFNDIKTLLNTTKLDSTNVQLHGLTRDRLAAGTANHAVINDSSGYVSSEAQLARSRGGTGVDLSTLTGYGGQAIVVNNAETALALGSPLQSTLTESFSGVVSSLTAGEAISANNAVCLDVSLDGSSSNIYRVFNADYTKANRRTSFLGFAQAAATVTAGIYTWVASANFVTSNSISFSINGRAYTVAYTTDNATTLQAVATAMATDPDVNGAVSDGSHTVTVTGKGGLFINITGSTVTGGVSQPTITVTNTQAPSGQNVRIQTFGPLSGFVGLTPCALYYLNTAGGITTTPADVAPILVGQALSSTVLFISTNALVYKFSTPGIFVRSHGSSTNAASGATQDVEHYNFTAWSAGTSSSAGARALGLAGGSAAYGGYLMQVDGVNTSDSVTAINQKYDKASWSTLTNKGTALCRYGAYQFNSFYYTAKGCTTDSNATGVSTVSKWNGSAWSSGTSTSNTGNMPACWVSGSLLHVASGYTVTDHDTFNTSDVKASATAAPQNNHTAGSTASASGGFFSDATTTNSYQWNGSAWSSAITTSYTFMGTDLYGASCAYNSTNNIAYANGGSTAGAAVNTSAAFNATSWSSTTSSTNSRSSAQAGYF